MGRRRIGARDPRSLRLTAALAAVLLTCCAPQPPKPKPKSAFVDVHPARIIQFYARDPVLARGEKTVLCYGVDNANAVRLEPSVDRIWPSPSRCIEISPDKDTTYKLTAEGPGGKTVEQSVTVEVGPPRVKIIEVSVNSLTVHPRESVSICYKVANASSVVVKPGRKLSLQVTTPSHGCWVDQPLQTTTYTVTASGAAGSTDTEHVTVRVQK